MEDERLAVASRALARGWKMLSKHCDSCGLPLFLVNDREMCVYCDEGKGDTETEEKNVITEKTERSDTGEIIRKKLEELLHRLEKETEITRMKDILESIEICIRILREAGTTDQ